MACQAHFEDDDEIYELVFVFNSSNFVTWRKVAAHIGNNGNEAGDAFSKMTAIGIDTRWGPWDCVEFGSIVKSTPTKRIRLARTLVSSISLMY